MNFKIIDNKHLTKCCKRLLIKIQEKNHIIKEYNKSIKRRTYEKYKSNIYKLK